MKLNKNCIDCIHYKWMPKQDKTEIILPRNKFTAKEILSPILKNAQDTFPQR